MTTWPVEDKVKASTAGAGGGVLAGALICWALDVYVMTPGVEGDLPPIVYAAVMAAASAAVAFASGYIARHTPRPAIDAVRRARAAADRRRP